MWVRVCRAGRDEQVIFVHLSTGGAVEVARHAHAEPGSPQIADTHFPGTPAGALHREPKASNTSEAKFLALASARRSSWKRSGSWASNRVCTSPGSPWMTSAA